MDVTADRGKFLCIAAVGTAVLALGFLERRHAAARQDAVRTWPACEGVVRASEVRPLGGGKGASYFVVWVQYRYTAMGVVRDGEVESFQPEEYSDEASARKAMWAKYPPGREVRVYINPNNASETALDASPGSWGLAWFLGVLATGAGSVLIAMAWPIVAGRRGRRSAGPAVIETYGPLR